MARDSIGPSKTQELDMMRRLRTVLKRSSHGLGIAASFVTVFASSRQGTEREAVRRILLGFPVGLAFAGLVSEASASSDLLRFVAAQAKMSASEASRGAEKLTSLFERWALLKEKRIMERRVMEFRGFVISAVAGVVVGMLSSLAPLISSFQLTLGGAPQAASTFSPYEGAVFLIPSALCLGLFFSPRRPYLFVVLSLATFFGVVYFFGPFASIGITQ
ncbi:MAG: hypothetical protein OK455_03890 [Thaumarchaeota archaeon]|nr:hypothetical protein [Nitrososphaerota archaeon]